METRCRPHELFGLWAVEPERFRPLVSLYRGTDLAALRAAAAASKPAVLPTAQRYELVDGTAVFRWSGLFVKHPTSFSAWFEETSTVAGRAGLRAAERDPSVERILIVVSSPGGVTNGVGDLAAEVRRVGQVKPVDVYVDDLAASAALWAVSGARRIYAGESAFVGSIGVYAVVEDTSGAFSQEGVKVHVVSSAPPIKGAGIEGAPVTEEQLDDVRRLVLDSAALFLRDMATGRRVSPERAETWHTGQLWIADEARGRGLVDEVASFEDVLGIRTSTRAVQAQAGPAVSGASGLLLSARPAPTPALATPAAPAPTRQTAAEQLDAIARSLITRSVGNPGGLDYYGAFAEACRRNPGLVAQAHDDERAARREA